MQNEDIKDEQKDENQLVDLDAEDAGQSPREDAGRGGKPKKKTGLIALFIALLAAAAAAGFFFLGGVNLLGRFRSGTTINGQDVSYMTPGEAREHFAGKIADYSIHVSVNDEASVSLGAGDISMEAADLSLFEKALESQKEGGAKKLSADVYTCDFAAFKYAVGLLAENSGEQPEADEEAAAAAEDIEITTSGDTGELVSAVNAYLELDESADGFVVAGGTAGTIPDADAVANAVQAAVQTLETELSLSGDEYRSHPSVTADSEEIQAALEHANAYKDLEIELTFTPDGAEDDGSSGETSAGGTELLGWDIIKEWLYVDADGTTICVNNTLLSGYVDELVEKYNVTNNTARFLTTSGEYIEIEVARQGQTVNGDELLALIYECVMNQTGGEYEAPYDTVTQDSDIVDFGGTYVEVDLTNQVLYCYEGGELMLTSDIVTGCVTTGHGTPAGVFTIKSRETGRYLVGEDYKSWVNYWLPFNGGIGFHDATWRSAFGGDIYYSGGSHGCVNMPIEMAAKLYSLVEVGEYVVVYEGTPLEDDEKTETSEQCKDGHKWSDWSVTKEATCKDEGIRERTCSVCGTKQEEPIATVAHTWSDWTTTKEATCSAKGEKTRKCSVCGETQTESIAKKDHKWGEWETKKEPTCTKKGRKKRTCSVCGETKKKDIPALGHDFVGGVCTRCGEAE